MFNNKLDLLADIEGYSEVIIMLNEYAYDKEVPGICTNEDCDYFTDVELDSDSGWCEECETNTVVSCLVLAGMIWKLKRRIKWQ